MEDPFFRNRRWYQRPDLTRSASYYPVYGIDPIHESRQPVHRTHERSPGPKVVQIPVHFVGSKQVDRTGSAVKIQKVFRGFFVRKCLKKIRDIRIQVDEIEGKLWKSEVVESLRRNEKERLRMNETLMSLLFKLDSICGVDLGVRACRKAVIRKVVALQERIDAIVAADSGANCENDDQSTEIGVSLESENSSKSNQPNDISENSGDLEDCGKSMEVEGDDGEADVIDVGVDCEVRVNECNGENHYLVAEGVKEKLSDGDGKDKNDGEVKVQKHGNELDDDKRNGDLLERMMEESEKMTRLIAQLNERNEMQTKMLNALTNRVELLEKAFVCDRLRKKKKRAKASPTFKEN